MHNRFQMKPYNLAIIIKRIPVLTFLAKIACIDKFGVLAWQSSPSKNVDDVLYDCQSLIMFEFGETLFLM